MMFVTSFDSRDLNLFTTVLERACADMGALDENRREAIAARIMHMAQTGERNFEALWKYATNSNPRDQRELPRLDQVLLTRRFSMIAAY
jgi:hypothetical protein